MDREEFRLARVDDMTQVSERLRPFAAQAVDGDTRPLWTALEREFRHAYVAPNAFAFPGADEAWAWFRGRVVDAVDAVRSSSSAERIADWLGTAVVNASEVAAAEDGGQKMWLSRRDGKVRPFHVEADGQVVAWDAPFTVCGGVEMLFPGDPVGDPDCWINCRCVAMPTIGGAFAKHDLIFYEGRRTPEVVAKGAKGKKGGAGTKAGKVVRRRPATAEEERAIARGDWVRVNRDGKKPGQPGYMDRKSKVRPQNNALEDTMSTSGPVIDYQGGYFDGEPDADDLTYGDEQVPFWAVLAPEGVWSGDKRRFAEGALTNRDLPLPLLWQKVSDDGHKGSVTVGSIHSIEREGNLLVGAGVFADTDEADEVVGLLSDGHLRGISVDVDSAEMEFAEDGDEVDGVTFTSGRISAATIVPIPAFAEAVIRLGLREDAENEAMIASVVREFAAIALTLEAEGAEFVSDSPWDGSSSRFTPEQWKRSCVLHTCDGEEKSCHKLPIREPGGALNRNAVHNAAARFNQVDAPSEAKNAAAARLRSAYRELGEEPPEVLTASVEFKRGAGWVTHPKETSRLHRYWTKGKGAAKIRWGTSGDFTRCRRNLAKYVPTQWLNRTCAQWHHDALGYWPGELGKPGNPPDTPENRRRAARHARAALEGCDECESVSLVASADRKDTPMAHFTDPGLDRLTPLTITDDGRVFGHLAPWDSCHVGLDGVCVTAPRSMSGYAYFLTGLVSTDDGDVPVGQITLTGGHADLSLDPFATKAHYDETRSAVADITVGEDVHGIWFSGSLRDGVTDEQRAVLLAHGLSGDWRSVRGNLELIAALSVPVPGFPVPRVALAAAAGDGQTTLIRPPVQAEPDPRTVTLDVEALAAAVVDEMHARAMRIKRAEAVLAFQRQMRVERMTDGMQLR